MTREKYALLTEITILSLFFLNHYHSYIAAHFIEVFFITCKLKKVLADRQLVHFADQELEWKKELGRYRLNFLFLIF